MGTGNHIHIRRRDHHTDPVSITMKRKRKKKDACTHGITVRRAGRYEPKVTSRYVQAELPYMTYISVFPTKGAKFYLLNLKLHLRCTVTTGLSNTDKIP